MAFYKPLFYRRYVNYIFAPFSSPDYAYKFKEYLSPKHLNIYFSIEKENDNCLLFLNIKIFVKTENLQLMFSEKRSSLRYRPTSRVLYRKYKIGLIKSLLF